MTIYTFLTIYTLFLKPKIYIDINVKIDVDIISQASEYRSCDVDRMKSIFHCTLNIFRFPEPAGEISGIALLYSASAESLSYGASQGLLFILLWFAMGIHLCTINIVTLVFSETPI